ncbi:uncharacterized protein B0P05DRAFT_459718, partial [Gilbertella persicaria]|uniref:uncharacterized protein n=1 Tax=Gilbertella persicaria TaxID=101096 RepID=UPI00221F8946
PQDTQQKWSLYRATQQKLRRNSLPLLESIHLQKMLVTLLDDEHVRAMQTSITARIKQSQEDEDDIPLGTLIHKK